MALIPFRGVMPRVAEGVFVAESAQVIGDVTLMEGSSVWYNVVIRGDNDSVTIGRDTNIQDNVTIHVDSGSPCVIEDGVSVGHGAVVHGCTVRRHALVGIHAIVLNDAEIGEDAIIGAGAVVGSGKVIPARSLAVGVPAKVIREISDGDAAENAARAERYAALAQEHRKG
ncbi:MAG TPA: gamma carbonic anhydrase family protein [Chloroflexota bacterium]